MTLDAAPSAEDRTTPDRQDEPLVLRDPLGRTVPLEQARLTVGQGAVRLAAQVSWDDYRRVLADELFNLLPRVLDDDAGSAFDAGQPVLLRLRLRPLLARDLLDAPAGTVTEEVLGDGPLAETEHWFAERVLQQVDEVAGGLASGFATLWSPHHDRPAAARGLPLAEQVAAYASATPWDFEQVEHGVHRALVQHEGRTWAALVLVDVEDEVCSVYGVHPGRVEADRRATAAAALVDLNGRLPVAAADLDPADGELRVRASVRVTGDRLSRPLFETLLTECFGTLTTHAELFDALTAAAEPPA